jgi:hypothetical protein
MYPEFCRPVILLLHACRTIPAELFSRIMDPERAGPIAVLDRYCFRLTSSAAPLFAAAGRPYPVTSPGSAPTCASARRGACRVRSPGASPPAVCHEIA